MRHRPTAIAAVSVQYFSFILVIKNKNGQKTYLKFLIYQQNYPYLYSCYYEYENNPDEDPLIFFGKH